MVDGLVVSNEPGFLTSSIQWMHAVTRRGGLAQGEGRGLGSDSQGGKPGATIPSLAVGCQASHTTPLASISSPVQ